MNNKKRVVIYDSMRTEFDEETGYEFDAEFEHEYAMDVLKKIVDESFDGVLLDGMAQTWTGRVHGGAYAPYWKEFRQLLAGYEVRISLMGKRVFMDLAHHDGTHNFELRRVTRKGGEVINNNPYRCASEHASAMARVKCYTKSAGGWPAL